MGSRPVPKRPAPHVPAGVPRAPSAAPKAPAAPKVSLGPVAPRLGGKIVSAPSSKPGALLRAPAPIPKGSSVVVTTAAGGTQSSKDSPVASSSTSAGASSASASSANGSEDAQREASEGGPGNDSSSSFPSNPPVAALRRQRKVTAKAEAAAAALEWSAVESQLSLDPQELSMRGLAVGKDESAAKAEADAAAGPAGSDGEEKATSHAQEQLQSPQATPRANIKFGRKKSGVRRKKGPETTRTLAFTFSTNLRREARRRAAQTEPPPVNASPLRPRPMSGAGSASASGLGSKPSSASLAETSEELPLEGSLTFEQNSLDFQRSLSDLMEENGDEEEEELQLAQMVARLVPSGGGASSSSSSLPAARPEGDGSSRLERVRPPLLQTDMRRGAATSDSAALDKAQATQAVSEKLQVSQAAQASSRGMSPPSASTKPSFESPLTRRILARPRHTPAPPPPRLVEEDAASGVLDEEPINFQTGIERSQFTSIMRRATSSQKGSSEAGEERERHVSFCTETPVEVRQFCIEDSIPATTRGPRRVFGGELQAPWQEGIKRPAGIPSVFNRPGVKHLQTSSATGRGQQPRLGIRDLEPTPADATPG